MAATNNNAPHWALRYVEALADPEGDHVSPAGPSRPWTGERKLALAVLEDAVHVLFKYAGAVSVAGRALWWTAYDWVLDDRADDPFDFEVVCATVGIAPEWLRRGLRIRFAQGGPRPTLRRRAHGRGHGQVTGTYSVDRRGRRRRNT